MTSPAISVRRYVWWPLMPDKPRKAGNVTLTEEDSRLTVSLWNGTEEANSRGAGEILFTSMDHDGVKEGYANEALAELADRLTIPVIASGGAGKKEDFRDAFTLGKANAALAASVFHFGEIPIPELKDYLCKEGIAVRR